MELDEQQEWRNFSRRTSTQAKILHEELVASGLHQDLCWKATMDFVGGEIARERTKLPDLDFGSMNKLIQKMARDIGADEED